MSSRLTTLPSTAEQPPAQRPVDRPPPYKAGEQPQDYQLNKALEFLRGASAKSPQSTQKSVN